MIMFELTEELKKKYADEIEEMENANQKSDSATIPLRLTGVREGFEIDINRTIYAWEHLSDRLDNYLSELFRPHHEFIEYYDSSLYYCILKSKTDESISDSYYTVYWDEDVFTEVESDKFITNIRIAWRLNAIVKELNWLTSLYP